MRRICITHPGLGSGGSEACAMALLEMFQGSYETTLVTGAPFDCGRLNRAYNSHVAPDRVKVLQAPTPAVLRHGGAGAALRGAFFERFVKSIRSDLDLCISSYNFVDFGRPAIQFIGDFIWDDEVRLAYDPVRPGLRGLIQSRNPARWAYLAAANLIRGGRRDMRVFTRDVVVANSRWSADMLARRYGIPSRVIYPPVYAPPRAADSNRLADFVFLGRIVPEKRVLQAIDVLGRVRGKGHAVKLHVIGPLDESIYCDQVRAKVRDCSDWVRLHGGIYGGEKFAELGRCAFGLHMRQREPFGIAVAEMVKMGVVPFVPAGSAPHEIVDDDRLAFRDDDHAVEVIDRVLRDDAELADIRAKLARRAGDFSTERFVGETRKVFEETWGPFGASSAAAVS